MQDLKWLCFQRFVEGVYEWQEKELGKTLFDGLKVDRLEGWEKKKEWQKSKTRVRKQGEFQNGKRDRAGSQSARCMLAQFVMTCQVISYMVMIRTPCLWGVS